MREYNFDKDKIWEKVVSDQRFPQKTSNKRKYLIVLLCCISIIIFYLLPFGALVEDNSTNKTSISIIDNIKKGSENKVNYSVPIVTTKNETEEKVEKLNSKNFDSNYISEENKNASNSLKSFNNLIITSKIRNDNQITNSKRKKEYETLVESKVKPITNKVLDFNFADSIESRQINEYSTKFNDLNYVFKTSESINQENRKEIPISNNAETVNDRQKDIFNNDTELKMASKHDSCVIDVIDVLKINSIKFENDKALCTTDLIKNKKTNKRIDIYLQVGIGKFTAKTLGNNSDPKEWVQISNLNKPIKSYHSQVGLNYNYKNASIKIGLLHQSYEHSGYFENDTIQYLSDNTTNRINKFRIENDFTLYQYYTNIGSLVQLGYNFNYKYFTLSPHLGAQFPIFHLSNGSLLNSSKVVRLEDDLKLESKINLNYGFSIKAKKWGRLRPYAEFNFMSPIKYYHSRFNYSHAIHSGNINLGLLIEI